MKDFLLRTVSEEASVFDEDGNKLEIYVHRTRNSNGHRSIIIKFGNQSIEFSIGDEYEEHAMLVRDMLDKIINDKCLLPDSKELK